MQAKTYLTVIYFAYILLMLWQERKLWFYNTSVSVADIFGYREKLTLSRKFVQNVKVHIGILQERLRLKTKNDLVKIIARYV